MVKYEPRTHRGSRDMIENVPCTIRVFNQTGAHTHYPTNIGLLTTSPSAGKRDFRGFLALRLL